MYLDDLNRLWDRQKECMLALNKEYIRRYRQYFEEKEEKKEEKP